ncbi:MAG: hypothetical protein PUP90_08585 [Nostoc sp. S4]|nr:hypothetical protein [Nostoc sp. S4]
MRKISETPKPLEPSVKPEPKIPSLESKTLPEIDEILFAREELDKQKFFNFKSDSDARKKITVSIARRQGQLQFRKSLLDAYSSKCAITNFDAEAAL